MAIANNNLEKVATLGTKRQDDDQKNHTHNTAQKNGRLITN